MMKKSDNSLRIRSDGLKTMHELKKASEQEWGRAFEKACKEGGVDMVKELCRQGVSLKRRGIVVDGYSKACQNGHVEVVKYLTIDREFKECGGEFVDVVFDGAAGFLGACRSGHLEVVRFLTTYAELKEGGHGWIETEMYGKEGFYQACIGGSLEVVKFLTASVDLERCGQHTVNIHDGNEWGFRVACERGHMEVIRWLLEAPELRGEGKGYEPVNIHALSDDAWVMVCGMGQLEVIQYLTSSVSLKEAGYEWIDVNHKNSLEGIDLACSKGHWEVVQWCMLGLPEDRALRLEGDASNGLKNYPAVMEMERARREHKEIQSAWAEENAIQSKEKGECGDHNEKSRYEGAKRL